MIEATSVPDEMRGQTKRMLRDEMLSRGWKVWFYDPRFPQIRTQRTDGTVLELYSATPPTTSYAAGMTANNKLATQRLYESVQLPVPKTWLITPSDKLPAEATSLLKTGQKLVVKPLDAAHGNGVRVGIDSEEALQEAIANARQFAEAVLIQEHITDAIDVRLLCIDFKFVAALHRMPAEVIGDGQQTIEQLIIQENTSEQRGENYKKALNVIPLEIARTYVGDDMSRIPAAGERVQVVGTANVGTGGTTRDITDEVPQWLRELAEKAARTSQLPCCGVDFLLRGDVSSNADQATLAPVIIEVNKCPSLLIHEKPTYGPARPVIKQYVDYLASL